MRKSKAVALSLLGFGAAGCGSGDPPATSGYAAKGTGSERPAARPLDDLPPADPSQAFAEPDDTWYDPDGKEIPKEFVAGPEGKPVPARPPHDRFGRPWVQDENGEYVPPPPAPVRVSHLFGAVIVYGMLGGRPGPTVLPRSAAGTISRSAPGTVGRGGFGSTAGRVGGAST
ncbi:MAG: hypothetical protein K2X82_26385 [Gemmataceae bacterium]|nr:hypothetical protein [Gemmataceae bacterium]